LFLRLPRRSAPRNINRIRKDTSGVPEGCDDTEIAMPLSGVRNPRLIPEGTAISGTRKGAMTR